MKIAVVGGGIGGLGLALALNAKGLACDVYESATEIRELGVGITLLPHAMRELAALGLQEALQRNAIENLESVFFNRFGQFVYREPRGRHAGYPFPELGIHRGKLHRLMFDAAKHRLGADVLHTDHRCMRVEQDDSGATLYFTQSSSGAQLAPVYADLVIACDGIHSTLRRQFYPREQVVFAGINTWRGISRHKPILTGKSYMRVGTIDTGKMVIYPIVDQVDEEGRQLINWMAEIRREGSAMNDWNHSGDVDDFLPIYKDWRFPWLDVPGLIKSAERVLEYPMVDKDPVPQWTFGRVTLLGDAAHPMVPRGSNGAAQAIIDGRVLAEQLASHQDPMAALTAYESLRREATSRIVLTNRSTPPDFIIMKADELSAGQPFSNIDDLIGQDELRAISENYQNVAGFSLSAMRRS